ncbi:MAG: DUF2333 family protein [Candidatus Adiutrix sp.]|jgi:hypothetical protein|nr:DUF2333 family protein [Candidatus Adiutrix sp.]
MPDESTLPWYKKKKFQVPLAAVIVLLFFSLFIMIVNYRFPGFFNLAVQPDGTALVEASSLEDPLKAPPREWKKGLMTTDSLIAIGDGLFSNWLPNDKVWPTILLDNPQNFQLGALEMLRYTSRVMRDNLARSGNTDKIDPDCDEAFILLSNDPLKWYFPSAESRFKGAMDKYRSYRSRLNSGEASFVPRDDNLSELLHQYVSLLGAINTRLANAPRHQRLKGGQSALAKAPDTEAAPVGTEAPADGPAESGGEGQYVPWNKIDDNFYYAQGAAYVVRQMMVAVKHDFSEVLGNRNAAAQVDYIIEVLNQTQFEPAFVLNGDVGSLMANHSMELHSLLENARQRIRNLNEMITINRRS